MSQKYKWTYFSDVDISDCFFDSLKSDYPEFESWFFRKSIERKKALVIKSESGINAFLYLKRENVEGDVSPLTVNEMCLDNIPRIKIGTLKISETIRNQRLGEGAIGVSLWYWAESRYKEIYVTVFDKHDNLISLFLHFGFCNIGHNPRGESVLVKKRTPLDFSTPYKAFPFISDKFQKAGLLPIYDKYHDRLFPYSELAKTNQEVFEETAGNGITKIFLASPLKQLKYYEGMPIFVYRICSDKLKKYKSAITSFCTITRITIIKENNAFHCSFENFIKSIGNKSIYKEDELKTLFLSKRNLIAIEMLYNGFFGKGHNINFTNLKKIGLFESYPYEIVYNKCEFIKILEMGGKNVQDIIIDQSATCK